MKKHSTQFTKREMKYIVDRFKSVKRSEWEFNTYSKGRAMERGVDFQVMNSIWSEGFDVIEFHLEERSQTKRVLIRSVCTDKHDNQVCVVFNFSTMEITTVYLNERNNKHQNSQLDEYDKTVDVVGLMKRKEQLTW